MLSAVRGASPPVGCAVLSASEDGVAAVEFALVAMPFLALIFAILETALVFFRRAGAGNRRRRRLRG